MVEESTRVSVRQWMGVVASLCGLVGCLIPLHRVRETQIYFVVAPDFKASASVSWVECTGLDHWYLPVAVLAVAVLQGVVAARWPRGRLPLAVATLATCLVAIGLLLFSWLVHLFDFMYPLAGSVIVAICVVLAMVAAVSQIAFRQPRVEGR